MGKEKRLERLKKHLKAGGVVEHKLVFQGQVSGTTAMHSIYFLPPDVVQR